MFDSAIWIFRLINVFVHKALQLHIVFCLFWEGQVSRRTLKMIPFPYIILIHRLVIINSQFLSRKTALYEKIVEIYRPQSSKTLNINQLNQQRTKSDLTLKKAEPYTTSLEVQTLFVLCCFFSGVSMLFGVLVWTVYLNVF